MLPWPPSGTDRCQVFLEINLCFGVDFEGERKHFFSALKEIKDSAKSCPTLSTYGLYTEAKVYQIKSNIFFKRIIYHDQEGFILGMKGLFNI